MFNEKFAKAGRLRQVAAATAPQRRFAPVKIRTSNLLIRSQMLYPVELRALKSSKFAEEGCSVK